VTAFTADATVHAACRAGIRQVLSRPVDFGRLPPLIEGVAGPATSGLRKLVDAAPAWPAASLRASAEAGPLA
jgi:hypothetical protein